MCDDPNIQTRLLRHLGEACLTIGVLAQDLDLGHDQIGTALCKLIARGYVERIEAGCFQLTSDGRAAAASGVSIRPGPRGPQKGRKKPVPNTLRQRAWNAMRVSPR